MAGKKVLTLREQLGQQPATTGNSAKTKPLSLRSQLPATQTGAQNAPRSVGTSAGDGGNVTRPAGTAARKITGKAAESGYNEERTKQQQQTNRQALTQIGQNIRESLSGLQNDSDEQNKLALERKMGVGESWKDTAGSYAIKSGLAGTAAGLVNAAGTALKSDRKSGLAVDSGDVKPETTGEEWYNRAGTKLQKAADKVQAYSEDAYTKGTEGLNTAQRLLFDAAVAGTQMATDVGLGLLTGGYSAIPMAIRGFGSGAMQARSEGASENEQIVYGAASAAVEALTEKMFDGVAKIYGKGMADDVVQKFAEKIAKTPKGQSFVRALAGMGGEGLEEMISGVVDPALQTIYNDKVINGRQYGEKGAYDDVTIAEILYQGAVGALMGVFGGAVDIAQTARNGGHAPVSDQLQGTEGNKKSSPVKESNAGSVQLVKGAGESRQVTEPVKVGRVTTIKNPYRGEVPQQTKTSEYRVSEVSKETLDTATKWIQSADAQAKEQGKGFKTVLMKIVEKHFVPQKGIAVDGMTFAGKPYLVDVGKKVAGKLVSDPNLSAEKIAVLEKVDELIRNAEFVGSGEYDGNNAVAMRYDYFETETTIGGVPYVVSFDVEAFPYANNYRTHKIAKIELAEMSPHDVGPVPTAKNNSTSSDNIVPDAVPGVKNSVAANSSKNVAANMDNDTKTAFYGMKKAKRKADRVARANRLTAEEKEIVSKMLKGEIAEDDGSVNAHVRVVYEARKEYEGFAKQVSEYRKRHKADVRAAADADLVDVLDWKDKRTGLAYSRETMERNVRDITPDKATADRIISNYFTPVHEGEAAATRMKNGYRDRVKKLGLSRKVSQGNKISEAAAVQILGEAENAISMLEESNARNAKRDGKTLQEWQGIVENLWSENPKLNESKIAGAVEEFRKIYDELIEQMNEVRVRNGYEPVEHRQGYFPHFQNGEADGLLKALGKALGVETEVTQLPTSINGLTHTFRPGIRWFGNAQERQGYDTVYDAVEGFDRYIEGAAGVIHQTDNIQRLRALSEQIRYRSTDQGLREQIDAVRQNKELAEEDKQNRLEKIYENGRYALGNFVVELEEYTNQLANKKSRKDRDMEQAMGRKWYTIMKNAESRVAANMVAVNPGSWLTNFIPITQGWASVDTKHMLNGMWDTLCAYKEDDGFAGASTFLTNRRGSDPLVRTWVQSASATLSKPMEYIDTFTADTLVRARYLQNKESGLSDAEAMSEADSWASGIMADRSKGSTPTIFNAKNPLTKIFTQFQLEVNNQVSYLVKDLPEELKEKGAAAIAAALMKFLIGSFVYNELYEYVVGRRPALDPLGILNDTVGDFTGYELPNLVEAGIAAAKGEEVGLKKSKPVGGYEAATNLAESVAENVPFVGGLLGGGRVPISSAFPNVENLAKAAINENWSEEKRAATLAKELAKPATYLALPFGGGQLKKIYEGIKAVKEGGSYSVDANGNQLLQYPVYNDTAAQRTSALAKSVLFGKSSLGTAQDWVENGFDSFSAKETAVYRGLGEVGVADEVAYELIRELGVTGKTATESATTAKRNALRSANISGEGKSVIYYGMMASEKEQSVMDALESRENMGIVTEALMQIKEGNLLSGEAANQKKLSALIDNRLSTSAKLQIYSELINDDTDAIESAISAGIDFDDIMVFKIMTYGLASDSRSTKKEKVLAEINRMDLSDEQKDELYFMAGYKESTLKRDAPWW